jgi:EpsI family protein
VDVFVAIYSAQEEGREATAYGEGAFDPATNWRWLESGPAIDDADSNILLISGKHKRYIQTSYRTGDLITGSAAKLKLANMRDRLFLSEAPTMMLVLSSELQGEDQAAQSIAEFRQSIGDEGEWLDRIAGLR